MILCRIATISLLVSLLLPSPCVLARPIGSGVFTEKFEIKSDLDDNVEVIVHSLEDGLNPITNNWSKVVGRHRTVKCFLFMPGGNQNTLLSYRHNGKLYQRLVTGYSSSVTVNLSEFIERPDNYYFGNESNIDYDDAYRAELGQSLQELLQQQANG